MSKSGTNISVSQNFLHNEKLVDSLVAIAGITEKDTVYEIGPGYGIITHSLAKTGASVVAIELDRDLYKKLTEEFTNKKRVNVRHANALTYSYPKEEEIIFFSNIPFNITAEIMTKVLSMNNVSDIYFVMQYEAFLKYAGAPFYQECYKSLIYKPLYDMEIIHEFQPSDFRPKPNARIILAHICKKKKSEIGDNLQAYRDLLSFVFSESGATFKQKTKRIFTYEQQKRICKLIGASIDTNVTSLTYANWMTIFDSYLRYVGQEKKNLVLGASKKLIQEQSRLNKLHRNRNARRSN